jgi:hypothetical protein
MKNTVKLIGETILFPLWFPVFIVLLVCKISADKMDELNEWNMKGRK